MANNFRITPVDSAELSYKTKLALIELIRGSQGDAPFKLPNEDLLAQKIGVSRNALRDALASLEEMGFVTRQRSKGTLANPKVARETCRLDTDPGLFRMIQGLGHTPRYEVKRLELVEERDPVLGPKSASYLAVEKLFYADDTPVAFCVDHILGELVKPVEDTIWRMREQSCFSYLKEYCGHPVAYSLASFDVNHAGPRLQSLFHVDSGELFVQMDDEVYSKDLQIICHATSYYRKGYLPIKVLRKGW